MLQRNGSPGQPPGRPPDGACVVFDLDGTLVDTSGDLLAAANACFTAMGFGAPLDAGDSQTALQGGRAMLRLGFLRLRGEEPAAAEPERWYPELLSHYRKGLAVHSRVYPGALEAIGVLREAGYRVAICTNKPADLAEELLRQLGIRPLFASLVGADTLPVRKPDPEPYRLAVARAGGVLARSVLIGDTETDLLTSRAAGVPSVLVSFGPSGETVAGLGPDALLHSYDELPDLVGRLIG